MKQTAFFSAYIGPANGNQMLAAKLAGYKGNSNTLAVQGYRNMKNPKILQLMRERFEGMLEPSLDAYADALHATKRVAFMCKGEILYSEPEPLYGVKMEAADRVIQYLERSSGAEGQSIEAEAEAIGPDEAEDPELQKRLAVLDPRDRNVIRRALELGEKLAEVEKELGEEKGGPDGSSKN